MPFAAIYVPEFPVEAMLRAELDLRQQAVAVVEGAPPLVHVIAVNEKAAQAGVEPGMTMLQAEERLAADRVIGSSGDRVIGTGCDEITPDHQITRPRDKRATNIRQRSPQLEAAAHAALLDCACGFSPRVEDTAPDTVLLDLAGLERILGSPAKIARDLARRCSELGLEANVAVACNADAAMHAARGFPGVTVIPPGQEAERLGSLPIDVLLPIYLFSSPAGQAQTPLRIVDCRLPIESAGKSEILNLQSEILDTLDLWGVRHLRALAALPEIALSERLGQEGLRWQKLARGAASRPLVAMDPPLVFEESMELEYPVGELEPLLFLLNRMLEQVCARLAARALATSEVTVCLQLDLTGGEDRVVGSADHRVIATAAAHDAITRSPDHQITRSLRLPVPMLDAKVFLKLLQLDLQANPPAAPVVKVWLSATPAEPRRAQDGLFLPAAPEAERLEVTLAKIKRVVGSTVDGRRSTVSGQWPGSGGQDNSQSASDNRQCCSNERVGSPEILDTYRPDAFRMNPFPPSAASCQENCVARVFDPRTRVGEPGHTGPRHTVTALRVFRPPLAANVALSEGRPIRLACSERPALDGEVTWCAGPWRSSGEWWSEQAWSREEWDVSLGDALYRIYRDTTGWFVQGSYD